MKNVSGEHDYEIDFTCITNYLDDLSKKYEPNVLKKVARRSIKKGQQIFLRKAKSFFTPYLKSRGTLRKGYKHLKHTGYLVRAFRGKIKFKKNGVVAPMGLYNPKPYLLNNSKKKASTYRVRPGWYGGIWMNFGSEHNKKLDWVVKTWQSVQETIYSAIYEDMHNSYDESVKNKY